MPVNKNDLIWKATVKAYPAIGDLQAPSGFVRILDTDEDVGAPNYNQFVYSVPAGKIFMLEFLMAYCWQADPTDISFNLRSGGVDYPFYSAAYGVALEEHKWTDRILFNESEDIKIIWTATLATTDVQAMLFGYLIDKY